MDYYKEYCENVYKDESSFYKNRLIKTFEENGYDKNLAKVNTLPLKQYRLYKIYRIQHLEYNMKKYDIKSVKDFRYEYSPFDNHFTEYLKQLYEDKDDNEKKLKDYVKSRKCILNKKIMEGERSPLINSFLEYDKMGMIVRDIRAGVKF